MGVDIVVALGVAIWVPIEEDVKVAFGGSGKTSDDTIASCFSWLIWLISRCTLSGSESVERILELHRTVSSLICSNPRSDSVRLVIKLGFSFSGVVRFKSTGG